ncbi:hypothetical protein KAH27_00800 [bacterium]|nr:hypothetical protein [bacterium]
MNDSSRDEDVLLTEKVHAFNKFFYVDYKENQRGRFLKITEKDGRFRSTIIVPEEAVDDMAKLLTKISEKFSPAERTADRREEFEAQRQEFESRRAAREETNRYDHSEDNPSESEKY